MIGEWKHGDQLEAIVVGWVMDEGLEHGFVDGNGLERRRGKVFIFVCLF